MKPVHAREGVSRASGSNICWRVPRGHMSCGKKARASIWKGCKCWLDCMDGWKQSSAVEANCNSCTQPSFLPLTLPERLLSMLYQAVKKKVYMATSITFRISTSATSRLQQDAYAPPCDSCNVQLGLLKSENWDRGRAKEAGFCCGPSNLQGVQRDCNPGPESGEWTDLGGASGGKQELASRGGFADHLLGGSKSSTVQVFGDSATADGGKFCLSTAEQGE